jgi:hypothetical protein
VQRPARVHRVVITAYPPGSDAPEWTPPGWEEDPLNSGTDPDTGARGIGEFRWPRQRNFLSPTAALARATRLQGYGATVRIDHSDPITWPSPEEA